MNTSFCRYEFAVDIVVMVGRGFRFLLSTVHYPTGTVQPLCLLVEEENQKAGILSDQSTMVLSLHYSCNQR